MAKISTYPSADVPLQLSDRLIGTEAIRPIPSPTPLATKNFSLGELLQLFSANFPAATLQAVLNAGNIATQNINLTGTIDVTLIKPDNIEDTSGSQGNVFQYLSKGTSSINWVDLPVDNLQAVLNAGNTATQSITLVGNITSTKIIPGNIQDDTSGIGTTGQLLSKTASGIRWINNPILMTPGLADVLSVGNTATNNINLIGNYYGDNFYTNTGGFGLMDDGTLLGQTFQFVNSFNSYLYTSSSSLNTWALPDASGIIALTSDIPAQGLTSVGLTMPVAFTVLNSPLTSNGTIAVSGAGTASQYIRGDGQLATFPTSGGGGSSVNYYLNGSINASVAGYKQLSNTATIGGGTDFNLIGNGLIAQFLTDLGNPNRTEIPGGAWNFEMYFQSSSAGGSAKFYVELLKYDGTTFTSITSSISVPEEITGGTAIDLYLTSLAVPTTPLLVTDRLAIQVYIVDNSGGRTITLHTEDNTLCEIITTFSGGVTSLNGLTANTQYLAVGTTGTDFNISSLVDTHTFNLPTASATNRGALSSADFTSFNNKFNLPTLTSGSVLFSNGTTIAQDNSKFFWDDTNNRLGIGNAAPEVTLDVTGIGRITNGIRINNVGIAYGPWGQNPLEIGTNGSHFIIQATNGGNTSFGSTVNLGAKVGIKAQGALSTDIALRVRNSADTGDLFVLRGDGTSTFSNTINGQNANLGLINGAYFNSTQVNPSGIGGVFKHLATITSINSQNIINLAPTYNQTSGTASNTDIFLNRTTTAVGSGTQLLMDLQHNAVSQFRVGANGNTLIGTTTDNGGKLQIKAAGALSTDIALRVRNSADTGDLFLVKGDGSTNISGLLTLSNTVNGGNANWNVCLAAYFGSSNTNPSGLGGIYLYNNTITNVNSQKVINLTPTYNQASGTASNTDIFLNRTTTAVGSGTQLLMDLQHNSVSQFRVGANGNTLIGTTTDNGGKLQIKAGGALSTDIALRVRNSADTFNSLMVNGAGDVYNNGANGITSNTIYGENSGRLATGGFNTFFGFESGKVNTGGNNNTLIGYASGNKITSGYNNIFIGVTSGNNVTTAHTNVAIGNSSLQNALGTSNVAVGNGALVASTEFSNVGIGSSVASNLSTGSDNVFIGPFAAQLVSVGTTLTKANTSVFIGNSVRALASNQTNQIVIGSTAIGIGSNSVVLGNDSITKTALKGNVLINTTTDNGGKLQIKAGGALSTDIALRVRNSADSANLVDVNGTGGVSINSTGSQVPLTLKATSSNNTIILNHAGKANAIQLNNNAGTPLEVGVIGWANSNNDLVTLRNSFYFLANTASVATANIKFTRYAGGADVLVDGMFASSGNFLLNTTTDIPSSKLTVSSTTQGFLPPRMTNAQRIAIATPAVGLCVYCTDAVEGLYINKSTGWTFIG